METDKGTIYFSWVKNDAPGPRCRVASISQESRQRELNQAEGGLRGGMHQPDSSASEEEDEEVMEEETYLDEDGKIMCSSSRDRHVKTSLLGIGKSGSDVDHVQKQDQQHISRVLEKSVVRAPPPHVI